MNTYSMRVDYDDGSWKLITLQARSHDQAYKEAIHTAKTFDMKGELRLFETTWREACTTPHLIDIDNI